MDQKERCSFALLLACAGQEEQLPFFNLKRRPKQLRVSPRSACSQRKGLGCLLGHPQIFAWGLWICSLAWNWYLWALAREVNLDLVYFHHGSKGGVKCGLEVGTLHVPSPPSPRSGTKGLTLPASDKGTWTGKVARCAYLWSKHGLLEWRHPSQRDGTDEEALRWEVNASRRRNSLDRNLPVLLMWHLYSTSCRHLSKSFPAFDSRSLSALFFHTLLSTLQ